MRTPKTVQEVEKTFFRQAFGPIAQGRVDRLKVLSRIVSAGDRRQLLALKMLKSAQKRKKTVMDGPSGSNRNADLHWLEQDAKAMLILENTEAALKSIEENISPKTVRE